MLGTECQRWRKRTREGYTIDSGSCGLDEALSMFNRSIWERKVRKRGARRRMWVVCTCLLACARWRVLAARA